MSDQRPNPAHHVSYSEKSSSIKRLIVCCDGTWQGSDKAERTVPSNIARLCRAIAPAKKLKNGGELQQIVFYQSGVGTGTFSKYASVAQGATGQGLDQNCLEAYYFIANNYEVGDEIMLFGFSRGAYTARCVAGLLTQFDIIERSKMDLFPILFESYKRRKVIDPKTKETDLDVQWRQMSHKKENNNSVVPFGKVGYHETDIKVIGCFDTVGSMGVPSNPILDRIYDFNTEHKFRDVQLSRKYKNAFHAIALDEHRRPFRPTLWHLPPGGGSDTNLVQVWFPGVHINSGGGSSENLPDINSSELAPIKNLLNYQKEQNAKTWSGWFNSWWGGNNNNLKKTDHEEMADITLGWMIDQCRPFLEFDNDFLYEMFLRHEEKLKSYNFKYACGPLVDSFAGMQVLSTSSTRSPGQYNAEDSSPDPNANKERTNEYFHPSVRLRYEEDKAMGLDTSKPYKQSVALAGFSLIDHRTIDASGTITSKGDLDKDPRSSGVVWEKAVGNKKLQISEWQIRPNMSSKEYRDWVHDHSKGERSNKLHKQHPHNEEHDHEHNRGSVAAYNNEKKPLGDLRFYGSFKDGSSPLEGAKALEGSFELAIMGKSTWEMLSHPVRDPTAGKKKN